MIDKENTIRARFDQIEVDIKARDDRTKYRYSRFAAA